MVRIKRKNRIIFIVLFIFIILGVVGLLHGLEEHIVYFKYPSKLSSRDLQDSRIRLGGVIKEQSIVTHHDNSRFIITDDIKDINVSYIGDLPILFREKQGIVVEGSFINSTEFIASKIIIKHDEYYFPKH
ncbi:cytochrome c maturation protein CcmE domain-containing protein [Rickettsia endosymbiont of Cardiosporidium cionae]|uniref:cytochrome c maturation protein CcmE domain-containing protein n=1 Tax=Rickettsia endosymbiont of Cardiosporidium cionae TaxID=2777155 RepID=UPI001894BA04|nr:cytochrome c maturation protein CcmE [Rickettsia endosymbiont of Cardiosporidium cionae]KAF8818981.1 cytochrome c maturation protein CcmE [Rickettsia endosymbiont of Cardiosporidium cionae]